MKKKLTILGSTGSVGRQTLDVVQNEPESFEVVALSAWKNIDLLKMQISNFKPKYVVVKDEKIAKDLKNKLRNNINCSILYGEYGLSKVSTMQEIEMVVVAITGFAALKPTIEAINAKKDICIANKEIIVSAGEIIISKARENGVKLIPIDSEHSGILQCIQPQSFDRIEKIIITASGGPFYNLKETALDAVSVEDALNHPNWEMGNKVSIDSATMMNKGLEVIEAYWLFNIPINKIEIIIHPQSYIHAFVQYEDGSVIAQLSNHDMRIPIHFALHYPKRVKNNLSRINLAQIGQLTFKKIDTKRFQSIELCYDAIRQGGTAPAALNAANEVAVNAFLKKSLKFKNIVKIVSSVMSKHKNKNNPDIYDIINQDKETRKITEKFCDEIK